MFQASQTNCWGLFRYCEIGQVEQSTNIPFRSSLFFLLVFCLFVDRADLLTQVHKFLGHGLPASSCPFQSVECAVQIAPIKAGPPTRFSNLVLFLFYDILHESSGRGLPHIHQGPLHEIREPAAMTLKPSVVQDQIRSHQNRCGNMPGDSELLSCTT